MSKQLGPTIESAAELERKIIEREKPQYSVSNIVPSPYNLDRTEWPVIPGQEVSGLRQLERMTKTLGPLNAFMGGFVGQSIVPELLTGEKLSIEANTTTEKVAKFAGEATEIGFELASIAKLAVQSGLMPMGKYLFPKLGIEGFGAVAKETAKRSVRAGADFAAWEATRQARLHTAEAIHGTDVGAGGKEAIAESFALGALLTAGGYSAVGASKLGGKTLKAIWRFLQPAEQAATRRALGTVANASVDEVAAEFGKQAGLYNPDLWLGDFKVNKGVALGIVDRFSQLIATRDAVLGDALRENIISRSVKEAKGLAKPITSGIVLSPEKIKTATTMFPEPVTNQASLEAWGNKVADKLGIERPKKWVWSEEPIGAHGTTEGNLISSKGVGSPAITPDTITIDVGTHRYPYAGTKVPGEMNQDELKETIVHELTHYGTPPIWLRRGGKEYISWHGKPFKTALGENKTKLIQWIESVKPVELERQLVAPFDKKTVSEQALYELSQRKITNMGDLLRSDKALLSGMSDSTLEELNAAVKKVTGGQLATPEELLIIKASPTSRESTMIAQIGRQGWAKSILTERAKDTGFPAIPNDPEGIQITKEILTRMAGQQEAYTRHPERSMFRRSFDKRRKWNPLASLRFAAQAFENNTGVPITHLVRRMTDNRALGDYSATSEVMSLLPVKDVITITEDANLRIAKYLFNSETNAEVANTITPAEKSIANRVASLLQGSGGKDIQQEVFYRWAEEGLQPADIWRVAADKVIALDTTGTIGQIKGASELLQRMIKKGTKGKNLKKAIKTVAKDNNWNEETISTFEKFVTDKDVSAVIKDTKSFPKRTLEEGKIAWSQGRLREWIDKQPRWGIRTWYYITDPKKFDIFDASLNKFGLSPFNAPIKVSELPGTLGYESHQRKNKNAVMKTGSVVNNVLTHMRRARIAIFVHDDLKAFMDRAGRVDTTKGDRRVLSNTVNNFLLRYQPTDFPFESLAKMTGWFWKYTMGMITKPQTASWRMIRDAGQLPGLGSYAVSSATMAKTPWALSLYVRSQVTGGKSLEAHDPKMAKWFIEKFKPVISQRRSKSDEYMMANAARISNDFKVPHIVHRLSNVLEASGRLYPMIDEVERAALGIAQYDTAKKATQRYIKGEISQRQLFSKIKGFSLDEPDQLMLRDLVASNDPDAVAAFSAERAIEDVFSRFTTPERSGAEQILAARIYPMALYQYPRTVFELNYHRAIRPMLRGIKYGDARMFADGVSNFVRGTISSTIVSGLYKAMVGERVYNVLTEAGSLSMVDPGSGQVLNFAQMISTTFGRWNRGEIGGAQAVDLIAEALCRPIEYLAIPFSTETGNIYESKKGIAGVNIYRSVRNAVAKELGLKVRPYKKVERTEYQKHVHGGLGKFEYPVKPQPGRPISPQEWDRRFGQR
jgi:hypothetical protein